MGRKRKKSKDQLRNSVVWKLSSYERDIKYIRAKVMGKKLTEEVRSDYAVQLAIVKGAKAFSAALREHLHMFRGCLGMVLKTRVIYPVTVILPGTGKNGKDEYILMELAATIRCINDAEGHKEALKKLNDRVKEIQEEEDGMVTADEEYGGTVEGLEIICPPGPEGGGGVQIEQQATA